VKRAAIVAALLLLPSGLFADAGVEHRTEYGDGSWTVCVVVDLPPFPKWKWCFTVPPGQIPNVIAASALSPLPVTIEACQ
jgi:hypothetical protein